jgi:hypothetical protein
VDLGDYLVLGNYNGNPYNDTLRFSSGTALAAGDVFVVANDQAQAGILALADSIIENPYGDGTSYIAAFNGDDVRALAHVSGADTTLLDIIGTLDGDGDGVPGEGSEDDPGSGFDVAGVSAATKDHTLVRKGGVHGGNLGDWTASAGTSTEDSEWIVAEKPSASYTPETLGSHSMTYAANFAIDMNYTGYPNADYSSVVINGSWNGWGGWGVELLDEDGDGIYTGTLSDLADATMIEYVVAVTGATDGWSGWGVIFNTPLESDCDYVLGDGVGNYGFTIDGADVDLAHCAGGCETTCLDPDAVDVIFNLVDSYGDGWNGNSLIFGDDAMTIETGTEASFTYLLSGGVHIYSYDAAGSWQSENSWTVTLDDGTVLSEGFGSDGAAEYAFAVGEIVLGCMDPEALNYNPDADADDGSCIYEYGGSCEYPLDGGVVNGDTIYAATTEAGDADWYSFEVDVDYDNISVSLCGSGYDTQLEVWGACTSSTFLGYNDDAPCGNFNSQVDLTDVAAGTYHAKVYGFGSGFGDYILTITAWDNPTEPVLTATGAPGAVVLDWEPVP